MNGAKQWVILFFFLLVSSTEVAFAEGNCPPGYYPIGGQGVQGCAPIPSSGAASSSPEVQLNRPTGRWTKTWGAIAESKTTQDAGTSVGKRSKEEASREAISKCRSAGAADCSVSFTYQNQCVSWVIPRGVLAQALLGLELVPRPNGPNSTRKPCAKMISRDIAKRSIRTAVSRYLMNSKLQAYVAP